MRASLNRAKKVPKLAEEVAKSEYPAALLRAFDDLLERLGTTGNRFERWCDSITAKLQSESHSEYQEGLEQLGQALAYYAVRPRHSSATDCLWRGVFGNTREVITFEAKIEAKTSQQISSSDVGQAHVQLARAKREYESQGFTVRGTIVTHLPSIAPDAEASTESIKVLEKTAVSDLWNRVRSLLSLYRDDWSLDDISARLAATEVIQAKLPQTGWLIRALDTDERFIKTEHLLAEWD